MNSTEDSSGLFAQQIINLLLIVSIISGYSSYRNHTVPPTLLQMFLEYYSLFLPQGLYTVLISLL